MNDDFEKEFNNYREELSSYLYKNSITLVEYAESIGENYISPILYPENIDELNKAKKSFEIYKAIRDSESNMYLDTEKNYVCVIFHAVIDEIRGQRNYKKLESAIYEIFIDSKRRGKIRSDMKIFFKNRAANVKLVSLMVEGCKDENELSMLMDKADYLVSTILDGVSSKFMRENPELRECFSKNIKYKGMDSYINLNQDIYSYIVSEKLNVTPYEKKLK